jgi:SAM-dependent methyltransferase
VVARRDGFDTVADLYHRVRPRYPDALFATLFSRLPAAPDVVEVGPGTGQATGDLLDRGAHVTAVELGANLAAHLHRSYAGRPALQIVVSSFEDAVLPARAFDAVVAATSYHWVPAPERLEKPARLLRPGGWIGVIDTMQVSAPEDRGFFERVQPIYDHHGEPASHPPAAPPDAVVSPIFSELASSDRYGPPELHRYRWDQTYDASTYGDLMRSYSTTMAMGAGKGEALIADVTGLIDDEFGGQVTRPLVITLTMARTPRPDPPA